MRAAKGCCGTSAATWWDCHKFDLTLGGFDPTWLPSIDYCSQLRNVKAGNIQYCTLTNANSELVATRTKVTIVFYGVVMYK